MKRNYTEQTNLGKTGVVKREKFGRRKKKIR